jgi:hypothetical protein
MLRKQFALVLLNTVIGIAVAPPSLPPSSAKQNGGLRRAKQGWRNPPKHTLFCEGG